MAEQGKVTFQPTATQMETQLLQAFPQYQRQLNELMPIVKAATGRYYVESLKALSGILAQKDKFSSDIFVVLKTLVPVSKDAERFLGALNNLLSNPSIKKIDTPGLNKLNEVIRLTSGRINPDTELAQTSIDVLFRNQKFTSAHLDFFYHALTSTQKKITNTAVRYLWSLSTDIEGFDTQTAKVIFDQCAKRKGDLEEYLHAFAILGRRMPDEEKIDEKFIGKFCDLIDYALSSVGKTGISAVFSLCLNRQINPTNLDKVTVATFKDVCQIVEQVQRKTGGKSLVELAYLITKFDLKEVALIPKQFADQTEAALSLIYSLVMSNRTLSVAISDATKIMKNRHADIIVTLWLQVNSVTNMPSENIEHIINFTNALPDKLDPQVKAAIIKMTSARTSSSSFNINDFDNNYGTYIYGIAKLVYKEKPNCNPLIFDLIGAVLRNKEVYSINPKILNLIYGILLKTTKDNVVEISNILSSPGLLERKCIVVATLLERKDNNKFLMAFRKLVTLPNFDEYAMDLVEKGLGKKELVNYIELVQVVVSRGDAKAILKEADKNQKLLVGLGISKPEMESIIYLFYITKSMSDYEIFLKALYKELDGGIDNKKDALKYLFYILINKKPEKQYFDALIRSTKMRGIDGLAHLSQINSLFQEDSKRFIEPAKKLIARLKIDADDIVTIMNFAYALKIFGGDESKVALLYKELGIKYFLRYSEKAITKTYERWTSGNISNPAFSYIAYKDHNGALYQFRDQIDKLNDNYGFIITEGIFDSGYFEMADKVSQRAKGKAIVVSFVSGHGLPGSVSFGNSDYDEQTLDLSDTRRMKKSKAFDQNTIFIFFSCSTGAKVDGNKEVISQMISRAKEAVAIAPRLDMYGGNIVINKGKIEKVIYSYRNSEDGTESNEDGQVFVRGVRTNRVP